MALILNIDTAVETASVCLARNGIPEGMMINETQKDHASWLHEAIRRLLAEKGYTARDLQAIGVTIGPGSYTGLRIGLAAAKGFSYALHIPLVTTGTLEMMASAVGNEATDLICPMIDARRSEVFTAVYDKSLHRIQEPSAMILDGNSFSGLLAQQSILFTGNGAQKLNSIISNPRAVFSNKKATAADLAVLSQKRFEAGQFAELAYTEPFYIKEFYTTSR